MSGEDTPNPAISLKAAIAGVPPQAAVQEKPPPFSFPDWASYTQAFHRERFMPQFFYLPTVVSSSNPWGSQHITAPYCIPTPMYHHASVSTHLSMATGPMYIAAEAERRATESAISHPGNPGFADGDASQSVSESESSTSVREESMDLQRKKPDIEKFRDGEIMLQAAAVQYNSATAEASYIGRGPPATKLPISAPSRVVSHNFASCMNDKINLQNAPHAVMNDSPTVPNDRGSRSQRRKLSNRESARRSRLRKQQECEELSRRVEELRKENDALRSEIKLINKDCEQLERESASIKEELIQAYGPDILSALKGENGDPTRNQPAPH